MTGLLENELVVIDHNVDDHVNQSGLNRFVAGPELLNDITVATVELAQEKHDKKERGDCNFAVCHLKNQAVKLRPKS
jgi:hypothetical protein